MLPGSAGGSFHCFQSSLVDRVFLLKVTVYVQTHRHASSSLPSASAVIHMHVLKTVLTSISLILAQAHVVDFILPLYRFSGWGEKFWKW